MCGDSSVSNGGAKRKIRADHTSEVIYYKVCVYDSL